MAREFQLEKIDMTWDQYEVVLKRMYERARKIDQYADHHPAPATAPHAHRAPNLPGAPYKDIELTCQFTDRETHKVCSDKYTFTALDQKFFAQNDWGPPNACPRHRQMKKEMAAARKQRDKKEATPSESNAGLHHAATPDEDSEDPDEHYHTDGSYERNSISSSDGDTDYEDKCPDNY
jgi:hypothetical protein